MKEHMQIQLNQVEIETAIRNYVHEQINVREGMQIDITLKATRGDDGQTAIIDIVPAKVVAPVAEVKTTAVAVQRRPRLGTSTPAADTKNDATQGVSGSVGGTDSKEASDTKQVEGNEKVAQADNSTSSDAGATTGTADAASQVGEAAQTGEAGEQQGDVPEKRTSLFSGLSRPKNS